MPYFILFQDRLLDVDWDLLRGLESSHCISLAYWLKSIQIDSKNITHLILFLRIGLILNTSKYLITCDRYDSFVWSIAYHWIRFSTPCLTICKQTTVISIPCIIQDLLSELNLVVKTIDSLHIDKPSIDHNTCQMLAHIFHFHWL